MFIFRILILSIFCGAAAISLPAPPAQAQDGPLTDSEIQAAQMLRRHVRAGRSVDEIRGGVLRLFDAADLDGGGIGESDHLVRMQQFSAKQRVALLMKLLVHDLDNDGALTEEELRRSLTPQARKPLRSTSGEFSPTPEQIAETLEKLVRDLKLSELDADGDGRVTVAEISISTREKALSGQMMARQIQIDPAFDADGDGVIAAGEFTDAINAVIARIDSDGDESISQDEIVAYGALMSVVQRRVRKMQVQARQRKKLRDRIETCPIPTVPANAEIIFLGLNVGSAVANATFGSQGIVTYMTEVLIEPGTRPIYLLTTSGKPMILRFSGAVERLARVVNLSKPPMGFVGIDRARVGWFEERVCFVRGWHKHASNDGFNKDRAFIEAVTGRPVDRVIGMRSAFQVALPSGMTARSALDPARSSNDQAKSGPVFKGVPGREPPEPGRVKLDEVIAPEPVIPFRY
jgi:Ca2+-binding EF-hand superfamily protein